MTKRKNKVVKGPGRLAQGHLGRLNVSRLGVVIGSAIVFFSWVLQYKFAADAFSSRQQLEGSQTALTLAAIASEQWMMVYQGEKAKKEPNKTLLLTAAFKTLQWNLTVVKLAADRTRDDNWLASLHDAQGRRLFLPSRN